MSTKRNGLNAYLKTEDHHPTLFSLFRNKVRIFTSATKLNIYDEVTTGIVNRVGLSGKQLSKSFFLSEKRRSRTVSFR